MLGPNFHMLSYPTIAIDPYIVSFACLSVQFRNLLLGTTFTGVMRLVTSFLSEVV
jgi:hypothetical protein